MHGRIHHLISLSFHFQGVLVSSPRVKEGAGCLLAMAEISEPCLSEGFLQRRKEPLLLLVFSSSPQLLGEIYAVPVSLR